MPLPTLKQDRVKFERSGLELTLRELNAKAMLQIHEKSDMQSVWGVVAKHGVVEWAEYSVDEIEAAVGAITLQEIGHAIYKLTGMDLGKNSEPGQSGGSASG